VKKNFYDFAIKKSSRSLSRTLSDSTKINALPWLLLITAIGAVLRLYHLGQASLWYDEANTIVFTNYVWHPLDLINIDKNTDPALFIVFTWAWKNFILLFWSFKPGSISYDFVLRFLPCLFGIACIPVVFFACKSVLKIGKASRGAEQVCSDNVAALIAATLVAISPFHLFYAQELRNYSLFTLLGTLVLWSLANALRKNSHWNFAILGLLLSLSFWNHFFSFWLFVVVDILIVLHFGFSVRYYFKWIFWHSISLLLCLPAIHQAYGVTQIVNGIKGQWMPAPDYKTAFITFKAFFAGYSPYAWAYWPLFLIAFILFFYGLYVIRKNCKAALLLLLWTWFPIIACVLIWRARDFSYYEIRLFLCSAMAASMGVAIGLSRIPHRPRAILLLLICLLTLPSLKAHYNNQIHPLQHHRLAVRHKVDNRDAAAYVGTHVEPGELIAHFSHVTMQPFRIYQPGLLQKHIVLTEDGIQGFLNAYPNEPMWRELELVPELIEDAVGSRDSVWLVISWWEAFEIPPSADDILNWFNSRFSVMEIEEFTGIKVVHFKRLSPQG